MDIEEFYAADERRRASEELELGREWHDAKGVRYELSWVADTGELYIMREPVMGVWEDPFGDVWQVPGMSTSDMTVAVLGVVPERSDLERALTGWEGAMPGADSITWLRDRLHEAGIRLRPV
ncbi:MAG TPA: hypothetical protein VFH45_01340 [Acidimicrobiales bacterium]|nr:hypothetical protein [Acidimicrobiales bacterium]